MTLPLLQHICTSPVRVTPRHCMSQRHTSLEPIGGQDSEYGSNAKGLLGSISTAFLPSLVEYCIYRCTLNRVTFVSFNTHQGSNNLHRNASYKHCYNVRPSNMPRLPHTTIRESQRNIQPELRTKIPMLSREQARRSSPRQFPMDGTPEARTRRLARLLLWGALSFQRLGWPVHLQVLE